MKRKRGRLKYVPLLLCLAVILSLQIKKRTAQLDKIEERELAMKASDSPYVKLLDKLPVYKDSMYSVYITEFSGIYKIVFLKKDSVSSMQRESSFFVHIYPVDKKLLVEGSNHIPFNFKNNITSFYFMESKYYVSITDLPNFKIHKMNFGQYGYKGNNVINWKIDHLLTDQEISETLGQNDEKTPIFEYNEDTF